MTQHPTMDQEARDRQAAELEFVRAAYEAEAWIDQHTNDDAVRVIRRLQQDHVRFLLTVRLPPLYPVSERLMVEACQVEYTTDRKAYDAAYALRSVCEMAALHQTEEAIWNVWQVAEAWMTDELPKFLLEKTTAPLPLNDDSTADNKDSTFVGRNLIYSHHIIGKQKRTDMKALAADLDLTGYVKIGWPGIIIVEGREDHCHEFYDTIRKWAWQYLVLRGEMREESSLDLSSWRKFPSFLEVDSMSIVAEHCRAVGLEDLFLTSMKGQQANNTAAAASSPDDDVQQYYGVLVHVDHMNDPKHYRKWLQRSCTALDVGLLIQQCFVESGRPKIIVGLASSDSANIAALLKKWRSQPVDVDGRGQACLERQMTVLVEGALAEFDGAQWEAANSDINTTTEKLELLVEESTKAKVWVEAIQSLMRF